MKERIEKFEIKITADLDFFFAPIKPAMDLVFGSKPRVARGVMLALCKLW